MIKHLLKVNKINVTNITLGAFAKNYFNVSEEEKIISERVLKLRFHFRNWFI